MFGFGGVGKNVGFRIVLSWFLRLGVFVDDKFLVFFVYGSKKVIMISFDVGVVNVYVFEEGD